MKYHLLHFWDNPGVTFLQFYKQQTRGCFKQTAKWQCDSVIREHWHKKHRAELSLSYDSLLWLKTSGPDVWCWHLHEASIHYGLQFIAWINAPLPSWWKVKKNKTSPPFCPPALLSDSTRHRDSLATESTPSPFFIHIFLWPNFPWFRRREKMRHKSNFSQSLKPFPHETNCEKNK